MLFSMLDLPLPVSKNIHTAHVKEIHTQSILLAEESMKQARDEVRNLLGPVDDQDVADTILMGHGRN